MGRIFLSSDVNSFESQPYKISGVIQGSRRIPGWSEKTLYVDFYDIKGIIEAFLEKISLDKYEFILYDNTVYFDSDQTLAVRVGDQIIGHFGGIKKKIIDQFDIESDVFAFEFSVNELKKHSNLDQLFEVFSRFPFVEKDLAFVVEDDIKSGDLENLIYQSGKPLVKQVEVFDLFRGKQLGETKKSIAFRIRFQSSERTLNEKEVSKIFKKIINDAERKLNAKLRESS
jgi:phenylalanyl-tRNA synthetase beta chain